MMHRMEAREIRTYIGHRRPYKFFDVNVLTQQEPKHGVGTDHLRFICKCEM